MSCLHFSLARLHSERKQTHTQVHVNDGLRRLRRNPPSRVTNPFRPIHTGALLPGLRLSLPRLHAGRFSPAAGSVGARGSIHRLSHERAGRRLRGRQFVPRHVRFGAQYRVWLTHCTRHATQKLQPNKPGDVGAGCRLFRLSHEREWLRRQTSLFSSGR